MAEQLDFTWESIGQKRGRLNPAGKAVLWLPGGRANIYMLL
ncbi:MAG: hypothetical protein WBN90_15260 [Gammaproteobacteria bacterium]